MMYNFFLEKLLFFFSAIGGIFLRLCTRFLLTLFVLSCDD